jgi:hypothetical protein
MKEHTDIMIIRIMKKINDFKFFRVNAENKTFITPQL